MLKITITDVAPYDGHYELDPSERPYNGNELHLIKQFAGVRVAELDEAIIAGDYDVYLALATIALWREGKADKRTAPLLAEQLRDAEAGKLRFEFVADEETDAGPPSQSGSENDNENDASVSSLTTLPPSKASSDSSPETSLANSGALG